MIDTGSLNLRWADALIDGLAAAGVARAVLSPGSRSTPLVMACGRHPKIDERVIVDERSAAFFALGQAKAEQRPVILVATSGSAPANWYPAVIEASQSGIPLILLTADRPPELQGCGSNQTIDQTRLFGVHVRAFHEAGLPYAESGEHYIRTLGVRAAHASWGDNPGPVQINLPFREPLIPPRPLALATSKWEQPVAASGHSIDSAQLERIAERISGKPGLIICGPDRLPDAAFANGLGRLARRLNAPLLADPLSNLRFGAHEQGMLISRYDAFLRNRAFAAANRPAWVLRFGALPVSKPLLQYLAQVDAPTIVCAPRGDWPDPLNQAREWVRCAPTTLCNALNRLELAPAPSSWAGRFLNAEQLALQLQPTEPPAERTIIQETLSRLPAGSVLFSSNSLPIRQLDCWSGKGNKALRIHANRGVSGIDGNISTLLGLAAGSTGPVIGLLGDLAFYHDMNGLLAARGLDAVIILFNNGGGGIFGYLPQAGLERFEQYWRTPTGLDFAHAAKLYNLDFTRLSGAEGFSTALNRALQSPGVSLIEVMIDPEKSREQHQHYWQQIAAASLE